MSLTAIFTNHATSNLNNPLHSINLNWRGVVGKPETGTKFGTGLSSFAHLMLKKVIFEEYTLKEVDWQYHVYITIKW